MADVVYVLNKDGQPLMPTTRNGHVRHLLKNKQAKVVNIRPFTIQLLYQAGDKVQPVTLGIDPGRTNIGLTATCESGKPVLTAQVTTRNKEIPKLMAQRKAFRQAHRRNKRRSKRQRRAKRKGTTAGTIERLLPGCEKPVICKDIRNKEARFNNRRRPEGWLTPTANHLLQTHINAIRKLQKFIPISNVVVELNRFTFMAMENPNIQKWQYQRGPMYGFNGVEEAVSAQQASCCIFCKQKIEQYHHIVPRSKGGNNTLSNIAGLCEKHHRLVHTEQEWADKLASKKAGLNKKYGALSVLNQIIPKLMQELDVMFPGQVFATDGRSTSEFRDKYGVPKDHFLDAYCIACSVLDKFDPSILDMKPIDIRQYRRHDRQACHQQNMSRLYCKDGVVVAANRHKAIEQKSDSLEEYRQKGGDTACLTVKPHPPTYKRMNRPMPGSVFAVSKTSNRHNVSKGHIQMVMTASRGLHNSKPDYYYFADGSKATPKKCNPVLKNTGFVFV